MLAAGVVLVVAVVIMTGCLLAVRLCMHVLCGRRHRRDWDALVLRNRELDRELTRIWRRRLVI